MSLSMVEHGGWQRPVTWGEALRARMESVEGGLARSVDPARLMLGEAIGTRNTWGKLLNVVRPEDLYGADLLRAWLLLVTIGETPEDWDVDTKKAVPAGYDQDRLRAMLPRLVAGAGFEPATSGL